MKHMILMAVFLLLTGCFISTPEHHPDGPGNSENAPGHNKHCGEGPGNSGNAPGHNKDCN
jgi:hypothetical protein